MIAIYPKKNFKKKLTKSLKEKIRTGRKDFQKNFKINPGNSKKIFPKEKTGRCTSGQKKINPGSNPAFQIFTTLMFAVNAVSLPVTGSHERR
jgi:hypothetical protein